MARRAAPARAGSGLSPVGTSHLVQDDDDVDDNDDDGDDGDDDDGDDDDDDGDDDDDDVGGQASMASYCLW